MDENKQIEEMAKTMCAFYGTGTCYDFGEDVPSEFAKGGGCCLHPMELKKSASPK